MADDTSSTKSGSPPTIEKLTTKLASTREQLKVAVGRIVAMETREIKLIQRMDALELRLSQVEQGSVGDDKETKSEDSADSMKLLWTAGGQSANPELTSHPDRSKEKVLAWQVGSGRAGPAEKQEEANEANPLFFQHGIRAGGHLDTSKVVHFRFDGKDKDYLQWSAIMVSYLEGLELWPYVSGERQSPPGPSDPEFQRYGVDSDNYHRWTNWKRRDSVCKNILRSNVHKDLLPLFTACDTSREMWQVLKETYQMDNPQSMANLKTALDQCRMQKGQSLEVYIRNHDHLIN